MGNEYSTSADAHHRKASKLATDNEAKEKEGHFIKRVTSMMPIHKRKPSKVPMAQAAAAAESKIEESKEKLEKDAVKAKDDVQAAEEKSKDEVEKVMSDVSREGSHDEDKDKVEKKGVETEHESTNAIAPESLAELPPAPPADGIVPAPDATPAIGAVAVGVAVAVAAAAASDSAPDTKPVEDLLAEAQQLQTETAGPAASTEQIPAAIDPSIAAGIGEVLVSSPDGAAAEGQPPVGSMPEEIKRELQDPVVTEATEVTQLVTEAKDSAQVAVDTFQAAEAAKVAAAGAGASGLPPLAPAPTTLSEEVQHAAELSHERKSSTTFQTDLIRARSSLKETHNSDLEMFDRVSPVLESYFQNAPYMVDHATPEIARQTTAEREKAAFEAVAVVVQTESASEENTSAWVAIVHPEQATEAEPLKFLVDVKAGHLEEAVVDVKAGHLEEAVVDVKAGHLEEAVVVVEETSREVDISAAVATPVVVKPIESAKEHLPAVHEEEPVVAASPFEAFKKMEAEARRLREEERRVKEFLETRHLSKKMSTDAQPEAAPVPAPEPAKPLDPDATPFEVFHTYEAEAQKIKHEERQVKEFLEVKRANRKLFDSQDVVPHFHL